MARYQLKLDPAMPMVPMNLGAMQGQGGGAGVRKTPTAAAASGSAAIGSAAIAAASACGAGGIGSGRAAHEQATLSGIRSKLQRGGMPGGGMGGAAAPNRRAGGGAGLGGAPTASSKMTRIPRLMPELLPRGSSHSVNVVPLIGSTR